LAGLLPDALAQRLMQKVGVDRLSAFHLAIELVRRGGTISLIGVYGGMTRRRATRCSRRSATAP